MPLNPEGDVSPEQILEIVGIIENLLPQAEIKLLRDDEEDLDIIEENSTACFNVNGSLVYISKVDSSVGMHEVSISNTSRAYDANLDRTIETTKDYEIELDTLNASYLQKQRSLLKPGETYQPKSGVDRENWLNDIAANAILANALGTNRFTQSHYTEVMEMLDGCIPENQIQLASDTQD